MNRILLLSLLLIRSGLAAAADPDDASSLSKQAAAEFGKGHYEEASQLYSRAVALNPKDAGLRDELMKALSYAKRYADTATLRRQAAAELRNGRVNQAAELYAGAAAQDPDDPALLKDWMLTLWSAKRYEETAKVAIQLMALDKKDNEALNLAVRALYLAGHTNEAYQLDSKSHASGDGIIPLRRAMVHEYESLREYDKTVQLSEELLKARPKDATLWAAIGRSRFYQARYPEALAAWHEAAQLEPDNWKFKLFEAKSLYFTGREQESISMLKEIAQVHPKDWQAAGFLVDALAVAGDRQGAVAVLENGLKDCLPEEEPKLLELAEFYGSLGMDAQALASIDRALRLNAGNGEALTAKAAFFVAHGRSAEAVSVFHDILRQNPESLDSWRGLADALTASSETVKAIEALREARKLDPTNPNLLLDLAHTLYDSGNHVEAKKLLLNWMTANSDERVLPVFLYHGITPIANDTMLVSPIHVTTTTFDSHMHALKEAGYAPIAMQQAVDWFQGKADLPPKAVLITFDDDRLDSFRYADPILKKYGLKAAMMTPMYNIESNSPGFASWSEISTFTSTGRWEIQAHGDQAHNLIKIDKAGHMRLFLTNKRWLDDQGRLETLNEWQERIQADHESSKLKIRQHLGTIPVAFAYPEGDYGQFGIPNFNQSSSLNRHNLCVQSYAICFTQEDQGLNVRTRDPAVIDRVEPRQDWTPEHIVRLITDQNPFALARRQLMLWNAWEGHSREAMYWLDKNRASGVSTPTLSADEAQIRFMGGDRSTGMLLARQALASDPTPENKSLVAHFAEQFKHDWAPSILYFKDNQTRQRIQFEQSLGSIEMRGTFLRILQTDSMYRESGVVPVTETSAGLELKRTTGIGHTLSIQSQEHVFSGQTRNLVSVSGNFSSDWSDMLQSEVRAARTPYGTARALNANIVDQSVTLKGSLGSEDTGKVESSLRLGDPTDDNQRLTFTADGVWPFAVKGAVRAVARFTADDTKFVSPAYYSPQHLFLDQVGVGYLANLSDSLRVDAAYLPGFGSELGSPNSFVQDLELNLQWKSRENLLVKPSVLLSRTPSYQSTLVSLSAIYQF